jgi:lipid-A-disaccharide synthase
MNADAPRMTRTEHLPPVFFMVAGEASGDLLGARLMASLRRHYPDARFVGIGGAHMEQEGLESLFPMQELSVMGVAEVLPNLWRIMKRLKQTVAEAVRLRPAALITIDSPDFCFRVAQRVKKKAPDVPCVHYVAPSVWAWRPERAEKISRFLDHLLTLLPFEPPYFTPHGLPATFVGHPIVEQVGNSGDAARFRAAHNLKPEQPVFCMLPGSRMSELSRLLEKFLATADIVLKNRYHAAIVIPTLPHLKPRIEKFFAGHGINPIVVTTHEEKLDAFAASRAAIAASGTVTLELALTDTPHIIAYKLSPLSAWVAKRLIKTPFVNLINILLKKPVVPELLLEECEPGPMSKAILRLLDDKEARSEQMMEFRRALIMLGMGDPETPSEKAANTIAQLVESRKGGVTA